MILGRWGNGCRLCYGDMNRLVEDKVRGNITGAFVVSSKNEILNEKHPFEP